MENLKKCPFCGCHDRKVSVRRMGNKGYSVVCGNCGAKGSYVAIKIWHDNKMIAQGQAIEAWNNRATEAELRTGEISDGYHTFNELYHHRAVLFATICNSNKELAWKSKLHDTGDMYEGMFIVGIETPQGQATYHYDIEPYWDMFKVKELPKAPKWDGHTPDEAIKRIGVLAEEYKGGWIPCSERLPEYTGEYNVTVVVANELGSYIDATTLRFEKIEGRESKWVTPKDTVYMVLAWMPLPEPYQKEGE